MWVYKWNGVVFKWAIPVVLRTARAKSDTTYEYIVARELYLRSVLWGGGPGSSVGIATELRAGQSGIESRWGRDFLAVQIGPGVHPASFKMGTGSFPGVKCGRGVLLTTHPPSSAAGIEE